MDEKKILLLILTLGYTIAPYFSNRFFLQNSKFYFLSHIFALFLTLLGIILNLPLITGILPIFCGFGLVMFCKLKSKSLFQGFHFISIFPFVFSIISSTWFFCGMNQYKLLGYNDIWSFYAAVHGCFIGWLFLSGICFLSDKKRESKFLPILCLTIVILFFTIAIGIYQNILLKKIAVVGYSILFPISILYVEVIGNNKNFYSKSLLRISFCFLCFSFFLALLNEFWIEFPKLLGGIPNMVLFHGIINAVIVIPSFLGSLIIGEIHPQIRTKD
ncbi:YndJ family transporter [Leptospira sp. 96542]|nr:YndJ family transporter [Leptospira sp. 96542]